MDARLIDRLNAANIPMVCHDTQLKDVEDGQLQRYLLGDDYRNDKIDGTGLNIWGDTKARVRIFPVLARAMCLKGDHVFLTQMVVVRDIIMNEEHPLTEKLLNCSALFIQFFCSPGETVPYAPIERANIEQALLLRSNNRLRNYFSSMSPLVECTWWSSEFRVTMDAFTKDVQV